MSDTIRRALAAAGLDADAECGPLKGVTATIQQALASAGIAPPPVEAARGAIIEGVAREVGPSAPIDAGGEPGAAMQPEPRGAFLDRCFDGNAGTRAYKVYLPMCYAEMSEESLPLVVMLHGCTQSPADFAAGTRMNALADQHRFVVVYPEQAGHANASRCWNWFRSEDQHRDRGEPSLLAGMTREVVAHYRIDARRVFVAGLSAGGAMAAILAAVYPELFAAVGVHSGLPCGAAHDVASAFAAMRGVAGDVAARPAGRAVPEAATPEVPVIVFHGSADQTVDARNGAAIVARAVGAHARFRPLQTSIHVSTPQDGRKYRRTVHADGTGRVLVEHWQLDGGGHAWSGGSPRGSFTDARGPDASTEMIRFFFAQPRAGLA
ncbi:MAG: PHB depolymerase family esterase [Casimicrobiaceae bacterium]